MSEPEQPDDRELDDFLAGRSEISRAYREDTDKPTAPASFDASVLSVAAKPLRRAQQLQRWRLPVTLAASLVVVVGVLRLNGNDPVTRDAALARSAVPTSSAAAVALPGVPVGTGADTTAASKAAAAPARLATVSPDAASPAAPGIIANAVSRPDELQTKPEAGAAAPNERQDRQEAAEIPAASPPVAVLQPGVPVPEATGQATAADAVPAPPPPPKQAKAGEALARAAMEDRAAAIAPLLPGPQARTPSAAAVAGPGAPASAARQTLSLAAADKKARDLLSEVTAAARVRPTDPGWHAGQYQGLLLGHATRDDVLRRFGPAPFDEQTRSSKPLPDGRSSHRLLEYPDQVDSRGPVRLYFDANSQALASVTLTLRPALALATVEQQELLAAPVVIRPADAALCAFGSEPPSPGAASYPQYRIYPQQGAYLLLSAQGLVSELSYFDQCH